MLEGNEVRYIPDFILDDNKTIIELKGYERDESVNKKTHLTEISRIYC
jgi:very-short-patch-repair endonuclease